MKISVITPSYNQGRFIEDAIGSVLNQNYPNFEHIIIDGGSSDDTVERLGRYSHLKWISEKDEGQSDALNKGFKMATGDIICWLNADDFYMPDTFNKVVKKLINPAIDGVYADVLFCDKDKKITGKLTNHFPVKWLSLFHIFISSESFFFKRKIIDNGIMIDKSFHITMDKEFMAHILFEKYKIKYIKDTFAAFRKHELNKSINSKENKKITAEEGIRILNRFLNLNLPINALTWRFYRALTLMLLPLRKTLKLF